ncbi:farnesol dehydrogenase [Nilaparvata lugens]|uniref:farnesol dehydrogenase n=1 Tax=Nilaparvata lugens TaxID=108931 RepID=UPI000B981FAF|nr:farnesol dehydrogenase [Nilaparvata lugens]
MDRWIGRVAVVTGASSGIGAGIVKELAKTGVTVVGVARRKEKVQEIADQLKGEKGKIYAVKADITKEEEVIEAFKWIKQNLGGVDILINNAGITIKTMITDGEMENWNKMFQLNVLSLCSCTRETLNSLKSRGLDDGHIININSISGLRLTPRMGNMVYSATKFAAKAITEGLRLELAAANSKIRVTNLCPGLVQTEIFTSGGWGEMFEDQVGKAVLQPKDIADAVVFALSVPPGVQIADVTVRPTGEGV